VEIIQPNRLEPDVQNLAQIFKDFKGRTPAGDEANQLNDRQVLSTLIEGLGQRLSSRIERQYGPIGTGTDR
jgi:hypothetical protein